MPMLLYFSIRLVPKDFDQYLRLIHLILSISSVVAIIGILFYYFVPIEIMNIWYASNEFTIGYYQNIRRMDSIFWSPVVFGSLMAASSILCYSLTFGSNNDKYRSAYYIGIVLFTYCCVLSLSRGSWVNLLIGLSTIMLIKIRTNPGFIGFLLIVIISAMIGVYGASNSEDPWVKHIATIFSSNKELGSGEINRQEQREAGWDDIRKNIVFGRGLGKSGYIAGRDSENNEVDYAVTADNWYLKYFQESGIVGFIVFIYFIVYFIIYMLKSYVNTKQVQHKSLVLGICACFIGFSFQAYGSNAWDFPMLNSILWVLIGVGVNISQTCSKSYIRRRTSCNQTHKRSILKGAGNEQVNL
jgi:O-antigen ligase